MWNYLARNYMVHLLCSSDIFCGLIFLFFPCCLYLAQALLSCDVQGMDQADSGVFIDLCIREIKLDLDALVNLFEHYIFVNIHTV